MLHGKISKRLDRVLSVFDRSKADCENPQLLCLDDEAYTGDDDKQYVVHRLTAAAASPRMRQDMNVEDEYNSAIENRDTELMRRDKALQEKDSLLHEKDSQLQEKDKQLKKLMQAMTANGSPISNIAAATGMSEDKIRSILLDQEK